MKRLINALLLTLMILVCYIGFNNKVYAVETTAESKGLTTTGLQYYSDKSSRVTIETDSYTYGAVGIWASIYRVVITQSDESKTAYYICFIEAYIQSEGKVGKNYFRNKELVIDVDFASTSDFDLVNCTGGSNEATTSTSSTWSCGLSIAGEVGTSGVNAGVTGEVGYSFTKAQTYDTVNCVLSQHYKNGHSITTYDFKFTKWKNGEMVSPNVGQIMEKVSLVYEIPNFNDKDNFTLDISVEGVVFKDATWPRKNYTKSETIILESIDGIIM